MSKFVGIIKIFAYWLVAIFKGFGMGIVCLFAFLFVGLGQVVTCFGIYAAYLLKLAILTCLFAPLLLFGHGLAHILGGEMPRIGIVRPIKSFSLFLLSTFITAIMPPLQVLFLIVDLFIFYPMGKMTVYEKMDEGLCVHRWLFEFLDDTRDWFD